jgi:hypothetical protein
MGQPDESAKEIADQSRKIASSLIYRRLKGLVESSHRETRGKAGVAKGAILGFLVWTASWYLAGILAGGQVGALVFFAGIVVYLAFVLSLVYKYLR